MQPGREAERRLEATDDPREILALLAEVKSLQEAHRRAVDLSGHDVSAHGEPTEDPSGRLRLDAVGYSQTMLSIIGWTAAHLRVEVVRAVDLDGQQNNGTVRVENVSSNLLARRIPGSALATSEEDLALGQA